MNLYLRISGYTEERPLGGRRPSCQIELVAKVR